MSVVLHDAELQQGIARLKSRFPQAVKRATKRTGTTVRAETARLISEDTGLPVGKVKAQIRVEDAGETGVALVVEGKRIPLIDFKARGPEPSRGRGRGVTYSLPGGRGRDPHAFIATINGLRGVFRRTGGSRFPVTHLKGPSLVNVFKKFLPVGAARAEEVLAKNLRHEFKFAAGGR